MTRHLAVALVGILSLVLVASAMAHKPRAASVGSCTDDGTNATCVDKTWKCSTAVNYQSVTVTIHAGVSKNGVDLSDGCTGYIGAIYVSTSSGDGIKVGNAHDLVIDGGEVDCPARDPGVHKDGVQALGGSYVTFNNFVIKCWTANNSQVTISDGAGGQNRPDHVIFNGGSADPQGAGAYGISVGHSSNSGFRNFTLLSQSNLHDVYTSVDAVNPVWENDTFPQPCRSNFPVAGC